MPVSLPHRNLPLLLLQAREHVIARFRPILHEQGLTEQQWRVVRALSALGPIEQRQISDVCQITSPSLAGVLARMEEVGLVRRERMEADQRRVMVDLTPRSRKLVRQMAPRIEATYQELEEAVGPERMRLAYELLDHLIGRARELEAAAAAPPRTGGGARRSSR